MTFFFFYYYYYYYNLGPLLSIVTAFFNLNPPALIEDNIPDLSGASAGGVIPGGAGGLGPDGAEGGAGGRGGPAPGGAEGGAGGRGGPVGVVLGPGAGAGGRGGPDGCAGVDGAGGRGDAAGGGAEIVGACAGAEEFGCNAVGSGAKAGADIITGLLTGACCP